MNQIRIATRLARAIDAAVSSRLWARHRNDLSVQ